MLSLICAILAMSAQQLTRQYIVAAHPSWCSPEMRARSHAVSVGTGRVFGTAHTQAKFWFVLRLLPFLLVFALLLFFVGLFIFLFNTNHSLFDSLARLIPPLSWFLFIFMSNSLLIPLTLSSIRSRQRSRKGASKSWYRDRNILHWLARALDDDDYALEKFFQAIPDFFDSKFVNPVKCYLPEYILSGFWNTLNGFTCRTLSSNATAESVKSRLDIAMKAMNPIHNSCLLSKPCDIVIKIKGWDEVPQFTEMATNQLLTYCTSEHEHIAHYARCLVARVLASVSVSERNDSWIQLTTSAFGLTDLRDYFNQSNDSGSLAILIHLIRQSNRYRFYNLDALKAFFKLDIHHTLPVLQHDFCTIWNETVQEAKSREGSREDSAIPVKILREIRHLYFSLHQGTDAAPTAFSASTTTLDLTKFWIYDKLLDGKLNYKLFCLSSYPLCTIASHRSDSTAHFRIVNSIPNSYAISISTQPGSSYLPVHSASTILQPAELANIIVGSPSPSSSVTTSELRGSSYAPNVIGTPLSNPVRSSLRPADASTLGGVASVIKSTTSSALRKPIPTPASSSPPAPPFDTFILNNPLTSCDAVSTLTSNHLLPASSVVGSTITASPPLSRVPPLPIAEPLSLLSSTTRSRQTDNVVLPPLSARGLGNTGNMCFANAVLQLLLHSTPLRNLFMELGDLKGKIGARGSETSGNVTPLVDSTVRLFEEFTFKEEPHSTQQSPQRATEERLREVEETVKERNVIDLLESTYLYDVMKEKRQLKNLLVRSRAT